MIKKWLTWINYAACGLIILLLLAAFCFWLLRPTDFPLQDTVVRKSEMPKGGFSREQKDYDAIGAPALSLKFSPLSAQLPDLRRYLVYYGKNGRPDANAEKPVLYFAFSGNKFPSSVSPGERLYVLYDKKQTPHQYVFSVNNAKTPLWMEASAQGNQSLVKVGMDSESGETAEEPGAYSEFLLPEKEYVRFGGAVWELGKWRVDGTLLARQKARWYGIDWFFEKHGGEEYQDFVNKQRIDFGEGSEVYSVYVAAGGCLIWQEDRWRVAKPSEETLRYPLMCVKKVDDRVMNLELWDVDGKGKMVLNLIKSNEAWLPQNLEQSFKFVGARTRSQFVFEINNERMLLSPHDWLLLTENGWKKLVSPEDIDAFIERKIVGPLFVFDRIERKDDRQIIVGTFFNAARTEMVTVELPLQQGGNPNAKSPGDEKKQKVKETNVPHVIKNGDRRAESATSGTRTEEDDQE